MSALKYFDSTSGTWKYLAQGVKGDKGDTGAKGDAGTNGAGVPAAGTNGQVLVKTSDTVDYQTGWQTISTAPSGPASGDLTGTYPGPTLAAVGTAGTYTQVTTDSKGRVTAGSSSIPIKEKLLAGLSVIKGVPAIPAVMASPPTVTVSTGSTVSGLTLPYNTYQVTLRGWLLNSDSTVTVGSDFYYKNVANTSAFGSGAGGWIEFDYYGSALEIIHYGDSNSKVWAFVDGAPVATNSIYSAAAASKRYYRMTFATAAQRRIRVLLIDAYFGGLNVGAFDAVSPAEQKLLKVVMLGDSWTQGYTYPTANLQAAYTWQLGEMLNAEIFTCGQAGTGYVTDPDGAGASAVFTDATRLARIAEINPDIVFIFGSLNDDSRYSTVQAAATSLYATLASSIPKAKIIVAGPQSTGGTPSSNRQSNNTAVNAAANAAPNVIGFIDQLGIFTGASWIDPWINGSGTIDSGTGNNTIFIQPAGNHLTNEGNQYYARRFFKEIVRIIEAYVYS